MILLIVIDSILVWTPLIIGLFVTIFFILKRKILKNDIHKLIIPIALIILSVLFVFVNFRVITGGGLKISQDSYLSFLPERIMSQNESWYVSTKSVSSGIKPAIIPPTTDTTMPTVTRKGEILITRFWVRTQPR